MSRQHPFQNLASVAIATPESKENTYLIAACRHELLTIALDDESEQPVSVWSAHPAAAIILLASSLDGKHIVAATEDKVVRVFHLQLTGELLELSQRCMPKRPCAVEILPDNATIICADKFGDVYSLPLEFVDHPDAGPEDTNAAAEPSTPISAPPGANDFKPAATTLTVHTQRNRRALEAQLNQKSLTPRKDPLRFDHQLLLGHVSMLTDVRCITRSVGDTRRRYILTADRDEHIRVSRAPPQAHIIEGYCLAHTQYVNRICPVPGTELLASGGGDSWVGVWRWASFELQKRIDLLPPLRAWSASSDFVQDESINVSGIWAVPVTDGDKRDSGIAIICEKIPALFIVAPSALNNNAAPPSVAEVTVVSLSANPLAITTVSDTILVSLDARTVPEKRLAAFTLEQNSNRDTSQPITVQWLDSDSRLVQRLDVVSQHPSAQSSDVDIEKLLYGTANLRKRTGTNMEEED